MSYWTHIRGLITVSPLGRTQAEKRYILETVLNHLPVVTGSEKDMSVHIVQRAGTDESSSHDELGYRTNNLVDWYGRKDRKHGWMRAQSEYFLIVEGDLRDVWFQQGIQMFNNWLCRLASRVMVMDIMVKISGGWYLDNTNNQYRINNAEPYYQMFVDPSWASDGNTQNWCEYLMWKDEPETMTEQEIADNNGVCMCGAVIQSEQWRMCPRCGTRFIEREEYDPDEKNYIPKILERRLK